MYTPFMMIIFWLKYLWFATASATYRTSVYAYGIEERNNENYAIIRSLCAALYTFCGTLVERMAKL